MIITILTTGTRGDTQPYIALGLELQKAGHTVRIAAFENFKELVTSYGLAFIPIRGDVEQIVKSELAHDTVKADSPLKFFLSFRKLKAYLVEIQGDFFHACEGADAIIYHPGAAIGYYAAQYFGVPSILATPFPMTPTQEFPSLIFYDRARFGRRYNLWTHKLFEQGMWLASRSAITQFWKREFGVKPKHMVNPFRMQQSRCTPTVISCSPHVFPRPQDWSTYVSCSGYWFLEEQEEWEPPAALVEFLASGIPPVYVGFGSVGDPNAATKTTQLIVEALRRTGQRGILSTGWNSMTTLEALPEGIFMIDKVPHSWLFPRMAAVVHHGGAGTTAAGLKAGVPSVVIPYGNDQFAWGRRLSELGVGSKPIPRRKLTSELLADALAYVSKQEVKVKARELGRKIGEEHGARNTAGFILECLEGNS